MVNIVTLLSEMMIATRCFQWITFVLNSDYKIDVMKGFVNW